MNRLIAGFVLMSLCVPTGQHNAPGAEVWAFTGPWDVHSDSSLRANAAHLDVAVTGWIALDSTTAQPILPSLFPDTMRLARSGLRRMAMVTSWHGDRFHPKSIRTLASDDARLARAAGAIASHAAAMHYAGLVLDFEALDARDLPALLHVVKAVADSAHARGVSTIAVAIPATDTAAYPAKPIAGVADLVMPMLYDQHWSTSGPGAISSPDWVRSALARRVAEVGAPRVVAALATYGYQWSLKNKPGPAETVGFADAKRMAEQAHVSLVRDPASHTLHAAKPGEWEIWVGDAELLATLAREAKDAGVQRIALWRIGTEDPGVWKALGH